jgi:hypothetical protein
MSEMKADDVRATVRAHYCNIARGASTGCAPGCCSTVGTAAAVLGYTADEAAAAPDGADLGSGMRQPDGDRVAAPLAEVRAMLVAVGFVDIDVAIAPRSAEIVGAWSPGIERFVASATIEARKPGADAGAGSCCGPGCCT